jgi:hypothetical protein
MRCSICIATHDKPDYLDRTLTSIFRQPVTDFGGVEVIVVDDRGVGGMNRRVCDRYPVRYVRIDGDTEYRNPAKARNAAYRKAAGDTVICQSDDVAHVTKDCIERLIDGLTPRHFLLATVINTDFSGNAVPINVENPTYSSLTVLTGPENPRPLFFLGSIRRRDLYAVGGNDEDFTSPGRDDVWFADCLMRGLGLSPTFTDEIVGHHLQHEHRAVSFRESAVIYAHKHRQAKQGLSPWCASGGPWPYYDR